MSKLEELIQKYCPDGVEYKPLWSLTAWDKKFNGIEDKSKQKKVIKYNYLLAADLKSYQVEGGTVKLLTTNISNLYTSEELAEGLVSDGEVVAIPWGGNPVVQYYKGKFLTADNRIATSLDTTILHNKFLYYCLLSQMKLIASFYRGSGIKHPEMAKVLDLEIPVPPLPVQEEIVRVLDTFTELQAELQAELQNRLQQFNYYRDYLLSVYSDSSTIQVLELQQCVSADCSMSYGVVQPGDDFEGGIPVVRPVDLSTHVIHNKGIKTVNPKLLKGYSRTELKGGELLVCVRGTTGVVAFAGKDLKGGNVTRGIVPLRFNSLMDSHYMYHLFNSTFVKKQIENKTQGAALQQINVGDLKKISIPVPPLEEQKKIAVILDRFDTLTNDLTAGLPAEIEKRKQQYEYYRDKLLTFKRI